MITFETAKKLNDAGFKVLSTRNFSAIDGLYHPDLSELIEACGDEVGMFKISSTECNAWSKKLDKEVDDESNDFNYVRGSTPVEAVANLWLALNTKPK